MKSVLLSGLIVLLMITTLIEADTVDAKRAAERIHALLDDAESKGLSGYVLVMSGGSTRVSRGVGYQDRELGQPNTADTVFDIGSNTKQFTAAAMLALVEDERLALDQALSEFFPDLSEPKAAITLHQLLAHTAGFPESSGRDFNVVSRDEFLEQAWQMPLDFEPGERYQYSNIGYSILAAVIESVTGLGYEAFLHEAFFDPLGMSQTGYLGPEWQKDRIAKGYHRGYRDIGNMIERYQEAGGVSWNLLGNGGIQSTATDLGTWFIALQSGQVLSQASIDLMLTGHAQYPDADWFYGYGWTNGVDGDGIRIAVHNGSNGVYWSTLYWVPELDLVVSFSTNSEMDSITLVGREIRRLLMDSSYEAEPVARDLYWELSQYVSVHERADMAVLKSYLDDHGLEISESPVLNRIGLWAMSRGQHDWSIALLEDNVLRFPGDGNLHDSLGEAYLAAGQLDHARSSFGRALELGEGVDCSWCENAARQIEGLEMHEELRR